MCFDIGVQPTDRQVAVYPLPQAGCPYPPGAGQPYRHPYFDIGVQATDASAAVYPLPAGAGAASGTYYSVAQMMNAIAEFWGEPPDAFDAFDWNDPQSVYGAGQLLGAALIQCGVNPEDPRIPQLSSAILEPGTVSAADFRELVLGLLQDYCPDQIKTYAPPQPQQPIEVTTATPPAEAKPEEKKTPWGWIAAGAGALLLLGVVVYYVTRPTKRRNPSRRVRRQARRSSSRRRRRRNPTVTYDSAAMPAYAYGAGPYGELLPIYGESQRQRAAQVISGRQRQIVPAYQVIEVGTFDVEPRRGGTVRRKVEKAPRISNASGRRVKNARRAPRRRKKNARKAASSKKGSKKRKAPAAAKKPRASKTTTTTTRSTKIVRQNAKRPNLAKSTRERLPDRDFAIPERRAYPMQSAAQARRALTFAEWPQNRADRARVRRAVFARFPELRASSKKETPGRRTARR